MEDSRHGDGHMPSGRVMAGARRVVVIADSAPGGLGASLVSSFSKLGWSVDTIGWGPWKPRLLASAAFRRPEMGGVYRARLRSRIDELAEGSPVGLTLVVKGPFLDPRTIEHARNRLQAPVVCWNPDSPFDHTISNRGAGIPDAIGSYDLYVTWAEDLADRLTRISRRVAIVPFGWDPDLHPVTEGTGEAAGRIAFVGTASPERISVLAQIAHLRPVVFGSGWPAIDGIEIRGPLVGRDMSAVVGEAKWNLNLLRPQNAASHNMRSFEIPGAGGNQVASDSGDHRRFLGQDSRTVLFRSTRELLSLLETDPENRDERRPDLMDGHTYIDRVRSLLQATSSA